MDDWVKIGVSEFCTYEYNSSSVEVDKQYNIIKVWVKSVHTDSGINKLLYEGIKDGLSDHMLKKVSKIGYSLIFTIINYSKMNYSMIKIMCYANDDKLLISEEIAPNIYDILPGGMVDGLSSKILLKFDIKE
jgi:hypothetical protein